MLEEIRELEAVNAYMDWRFLFQTSVCSLNKTDGYFRYMFCMIIH
jgi:hypothetical protein